MPEKCNFPGCNYSYFNSMRYETEGRSLHRVPEAEKTNVTRYLKMPNAHRAIFLCSAHFQEDSFFVGKNQKPWIRRDVPFCQLLRAPKTTTDDSQLGRNLPNVERVNRRKTIAVVIQPRTENTSLNLSMARNDNAADLAGHVTKKSPESALEAAINQIKARKENQRPQNPLDQEQGTMSLRTREPANTGSFIHEPSDDETFFDAEQLPKDQARGQHHALAKDHSAQLSKSARKAEAEDASLFSRVNSRLLEVELRTREGERRNRELVKMLESKEASNQASLEAKDKEILSLRKQLQQLQAEMQGLLETNKALSLDLGVYRKLVQFESSCQTPSKQPARMASRKRSFSSDEDTESLAIRARSPGINSASSTDEPPSSKLGELKQWLRGGNKPQ